MLLKVESQKDVTLEWTVEREVQVDLCGPSGDSALHFLMITSRLPPRRSMRAPTWRLALEEGGGAGARAWRAEARGTAVLDLSEDGPTAAEEGTVDAGSLEGGVWHDLGQLQADHLEVVGWSLWFDAAAFFEHHIALLTRLRVFAPVF